MRSVAELFASDVALDVLRERFCSLIASAFRADRVTFALRTPEGDRVVNLMEGGVPREIAEAAPAAGSPLSLVLSSERIVDAGNVLGAPLIFRTHVMGAILAERSERYDADDAALLESCGLFVAARMHDEDARRRGDRFEELAFSDALTNIANRRKFDETFVAEWKRSLRAHLSLTVVMIDIDYFKAFNDTYGHQAGDRCLQQVAQAMNSCIARPGDLLARYGGEEFVALLPATPLDGGVAIAEAFQSAVAKAAIVHEGSSLGTVSLSIGVASTEPTDDVEPESLVREADVALYRAKEAGRNRVAAQSYLSNAEQAVRTGGISRTNLPSEMSRLIGRATECDEVRELLRSHRLVSIVGVGGSGKTRVSVQAAAGMINEFKNGVWFVDLSAIHQPELVATAVGVALSVPIASDANGPDELVNLLRRKSLLLVLDNCEHLLDSVTPLVERLMTECAGVYVLATSREPLAAPTERVYRLPVLSVPPPGPMRASDSERYGAIALFVERATAAKPSFRLTDENADVVARICRQVDGIALGIELTAARVAVASVEQLAEHLAKSLHVITMGQRGGLARHQTMLALIDWSYDLLSDDERRLFGRLAAFSGGWTLDMASHICIDDTIDPFELFDLHSSLLDRSLVTEDRSTSEKRFRFLEPIRAYAREKLFASGEADKLASAHSAFFRTLADDADRAFYSMPSREWFSSVQAHLDNYRAALAWSLAEGNDVELGAAIVGSLSWYFYYSSPTEGIRWINTALAAQSLSMEREARLWMALSPLYGIPTEEKRSAGERAVTLYRTLNVPSRLVHALRMLGLTLAWYYPEELELARELMAEAYELVQSLGDPVAKALVLQAQSQVLEADDFAGRRKLKEAAYELLIEHGNDRQIAVVLTDLSEGAFGERDEAAAFSYGREAVQYAQASGSRNTMLCAGINLAHYAAALGDWETAYDAADRALALADAAQATEMITYTLNAFACLSAGIGDVERSALLFGFCNARFGVVHTPRHDGMCEEILYRRASVKLRNILGETETQRLLTTGAGLSEGEAIDLALRRGQS